MYNCTDTENSEFVEKGLDVRIDGNTFSDNTMKKKDFWKTVEFKKSETHELATLF